MLDWFDAFGGSPLRDTILRNTTTQGNVMNLAVDAHDTFHDFKWGIEAQQNGETVCIQSYLPIPPFADQKKTKKPFDATGLG